MRRRYVLFCSLIFFIGELFCSGSENTPQWFNVFYRLTSIHSVMEWENDCRYIWKILTYFKLKFSSVSFFQSAYVVTSGTRMVGAIFCAGSPLLSFWLFLRTFVVPCFVTMTFTYTLVFCCLLFPLVIWMMHTFFSVQVNRSCVLSATHAHMHHKLTITLHFQ